jgi:hypothetical protein
MMPRTQLDIVHCYQNGDLCEALLEAAEFVKAIGERNVIHVITHHDDKIDAWYVNVVYNRQVE